MMNKGHFIEQILCIDSFFTGLPSVMHLTDVRKAHIFEIFEVVLRLIAA